MNSIRLLVSLAAFHDMKIEQFDAANADLRGTLEENVFMGPLNHYGLVYRDCPEPVRDYAYADWANCLVDRRSCTAEYC